MTNPIGLSPVRLAVNALNTRQKVFLRKYSWQMIQGRFNKDYAFMKPVRFPLPFRFIQIISFVMNLLAVPKNLLFGRFIYSNLRIHMLDLFIRTADIDPFDDTKNRYTVVQYKFDERRKQIVPTRISASTTLKGAQKQARSHCESTGLPFMNFKGVLKEYVVIRYISANEDLERSVMRHRFK